MKRKPALVEAVRLGRPEAEPPDRGAARMAASPLAISPLARLSPLAQEGFGGFEACPVLEVIVWVRFVKKLQTTESKRDPSEI
jgi:hypothetical protein